MKANIAGKVRNLSGWKRSPDDSRDFKYLLKSSVALPSRVDLTDKCPPVEDQSFIGSCTSNASSSALEFINNTSLGLSRLFLYYATRVWVAGEKPEDDNGAYIRDAMKALNQYGDCTELIMPYNLDKWTETPTEEAKKDALGRRIVEYRRCYVLESIKACLAEGFPLVGGFLVPENILSDECTATGLVKVPAAGELMIGGHAVLFVGYDDETNLLKFQNSWGKNWGDGGFGYLPYKFLSSGLADDFWTIRTIVTAEVIPTPPKKLNWFERLLIWLRSLFS